MLNKVFYKEQIREVDLIRCTGETARALQIMEGYEPRDGKVIDYFDPAPDHPYGAEVLMTLKAPYGVAFDCRWTRPIMRPDVTIYTTDDIDSKLDARIYAFYKKKLMPARLYPKYLTEPMMGYDGWDEMSIEQQNEIARYSGARRDTLEMLDAYGIRLIKK